MSGQTKTWQSIAWALAATALFTIIFASAKFVHNEADPVQVVFMRYAGAALIITLVVLVTERGFRAVRSAKPSTHLFRAIAGVTAELCILSAPLFIAYGDATAIGLFDGVITVLLAILLLKERAGTAHWIASFVCLAGALVIARSDLVGSAPEAAALGLAIAFAGAIFAGTEDFFIKILSNRERAIAIMLYINVLASLFLLVPAIWVWQPIDGSALLWLLALGPLALVAQFCWIKAFQTGQAILVIPISYASVPFAALLGYVVFGTNLRLGELAGAALIIAGGGAIAFLSARPSEVDADQSPSKPSA